MKVFNLKLHQNAQAWMMKTCCICSQRLDSGAFIFWQNLFLAFEDNQMVRLFGFCHFTHLLCWSCDSKTRLRTRLTRHFLHKSDGGCRFTLLMKNSNFLLDLCINQALSSSKPIWQILNYPSHSEGCKIQISITWFGVLRNCAKWLWWYNNQTSASDNYRYLRWI